jgi:hypothetical protein
MNWLILQMLEVLPDDDPILIERQRLAETEYRYRREAMEDGELPPVPVKLFTDIFEGKRIDRMTEEDEKVLDEMIEELSQPGVVGMRSEEDILEDFWCTNCTLRFFCRTRRRIESRCTLKRILIFLWAALWLVGLPYLTYFLYTSFGDVNAEIVKEWEVLKGWLI